MLRREHHHRAARCQRIGAKAARFDKRDIERRNDSNHTAGLTPGQANPPRIITGQRLTAHLPDHANSRANKAHRFARFKLRLGDSGTRFVYQQIDKFCFSLLQQCGRSSQPALSVVHRRVSVSLKGVMSSLNRNIHLYR